MNRLELNTEISNRLDQIDKVYLESRPNINEQGVWLFLATLGCWSVSGHGYQLLALAITFYMFLSKAIPRYNGRVFIVVFELFKLRRLYKSELLSDDDKKFWNKIILRMTFCKYSVLNEVKNNPNYYVACVFLFLTVYNLINKIIQSPTIVY